MPPRNDEDVALAHRCATGELEAIRVFKERVDPEMRAALRRMRLTEDVQSDVLQQVWTTLLVGTGEPAVPYITAYEGRGTLAAWVRVIAVRLALKRLRSSKRLRPLDSSSMLAASKTTQAHNPQDHYFHVLYGKAFRAAFQRGVQMLTADERKLLKDHIMHGMSIDDIAQEHAVHRATAARWLARAKRHLMAHVRSQLMKDLDVSSSTYESVMRLLRSRVDLSIQLLMKP